MGAPAGFSWLDAPPPAFVASKSNVNDSELLSHGIPLEFGMLETSSRGRFRIAKASEESEGLSSLPLRRPMRYSGISVAHDRPNPAPENPALPLRDPCPQALPTEIHSPVFIP